MFTKYVKCFPIVKPTAKSCLKHLVQGFFKECGTYQRVLSDNGTQFTSDLWQQSLNDLGVQTIFCSIRSPRSNPSERVMKELSRLFRVYVSHKHTAWPDLLPKINTWLNHIPHESSRFTPFEAQFNKKPKPLFPILAKMATQIPISPEDRCQIILSNLKKAGDTRKQHQKSKTHLFKVGDKVLIKALRVSNQPEGLISKFFPLFVGPYQIMRLVAPNACTLRSTDGSEVGPHNFYNLVPFRD